MTAASLPMTGARVWVTRPHDADGELAELLAHAGARVIWAPTRSSRFAVEAARILKGAVHDGA